MLASSMIDGEIVEHLQSLSTVWSLTAAGFTNFLALFSWGSAYAPPQADMADSCQEEKAMPDVPAGRGLLL
jgi:hypothetical protein